MADYGKGILGGFNGLVGTVVGATFRTIEVMRSKPKKSTAKPVQSQINQRTKFALITSFLSRVKTLIDVAFKPSSKQLSPMNAAVKENLKKAITGVSPNFEIDYSAIQISNGAGNLNGVNSLTGAAVEGGKLLITWDKNYASWYSDTELPIRDKDSARIFVYSETSDSGLISGFAVKRSAGTLQTGLPANEGDIVHAWIFFVSEDGLKISRSQYVGFITVIY